MKKYIKEINGQKVYKTRQQIIISKDGMSTYNPTEEMILSDGWEEYVYVEPERTIEDYRRDLLFEISHYDESISVNEFFINGMSVWLDKNTRVGLRLRFESELSCGHEETTLWYEGNPFPLKLEDAVNMLYAIEMYASACYDNTQRHISNVKTLGDIEEIKNYDYREGYPEKLNF